MADFKPITTQEELDEIIKDRLRRERGKSAKKIQKLLLPILADLVDAIKSITVE